MLTWVALVKMGSEMLIEEVKGNLRNSHSSIIKIRIREHDGTPLHKSEFRLSDTKTLIKELNLLKDKFGVSCFKIKDEYKYINSSHLSNESLEEKEKLEEWRERTKGLREDKEFSKKMKEAFKS